MDTKLHSRGAFDMSVDSTATMVAKIAPAGAGVAASQTIPDSAVMELAFIDIPWNSIAAFLTCIYVLFQICDWLWKKYKAYREWKTT